LPLDTRTSVDPIAESPVVEEVQQKLPGMIDVLERDHPRIHADTVDFDVVLGEVYLELDDGAEAFLKAGDSVIQNGARQRLAQPVVVRNCMFVSGCGTQTVAILLLKNPLTTNLE
jgi:hypothetical protein